MAEWINNLSANDYSEFNKLSNAHKNERGVQEVKIFRSNKGNLFSYSELNSNANIYFPLEEGMKFGECEHINEILSDINQPVYIANLFDKIKTNIASFRLSDSTKEDAANLLAWIATKEQHYTYKIKTEIFLLQDWHDSYKPFNSLLEERPKDTILFDKYCVKGFIPEAVRKNSWLLNPSKAKTTFWEWVKSNWANLKEDEGWSENNHKYISDIKSAFKALDTKSQDQTDTKTLTLFLDKEGKPTTQLRAIVNNVSKLTEDEYNYLEANVSHLRLLPYEFCKELMEAPFRVETVQSANIVNEKLVADEKLLRIFIKITDRFLVSYYVQESEGNYIIQKKPSGYNYVDAVSSDLQDELFAAHFFRIPDKVQEILEVERKDYFFASNEDLLEKAIERVKNPIKLFSFAKDAGTRILGIFFNNLRYINIETAITKASLEWQVIEFAAQRNTEENGFIEKVFSHLRYKDQELPESITQQHVSVGDNEYDVYLLDEDYKKTMRL